MLSDLILAPGETATLRIANNAGGGRLYLDNIAISGIVGSAPGGTVDADQSSVVASPAAVLADGTSTSTITVTLKDSGGIPVASEDVTLSSSGPARRRSARPARRPPMPAASRPSRSVPAPPEPRCSPPLPRPTACVVTQTASVDFQSAVVDDTNSTVSASPTAVLADDTETSTITVTVRNAGGQLLPGKLVSLAGDGENDVAPAGAGTDTTNASGVATFTVKSGTIGLETFTATSESVTIAQTAGVQFQDVGHNEHSPRRIRRT